MNGWWILSNAFSESIDAIIRFFFFNMLKWLMTFTVEPSLHTYTSSERYWPHVFLYWNPFTSFGIGVVEGSYNEEVLNCNPFFFLICGTGPWIQGLHLELLHQPLLCYVFLRWGLVNYFSSLASNCNPPDLWLLRS
jgi:hypothetical protein